MTTNNCLEVLAGQCSRAGIKEENEDSCGILLPEDTATINKGIVAVVADGVGGSEAGREASEYCVKGFISDYYSTPDSWTVQTSGERVIGAVNSWLYNQGQKRFQTDVSLASTIAVLVLRSMTAHLFHVGDSRIQILRDGDLRSLTRDHRMQIGHGKNYLARAMGAEHDVRIEYSTVDLQLGDLFVLTSDGVHEFLSVAEIRSIIDGEREDMEKAAESVVEAAISAGSDDNVTCQVLKIRSLPNQDENAYYQYLTRLPFPPPLGPGMTIDGYEVIKELHSSSTIQVYLARDPASDDTFVIKTPSINYEDDAAYIDRFVHEEWVGRRINSPHVLKVCKLKHERSHLYYGAEYIQGQALSEWIGANPVPDLAVVRDIAEQIVKGLRAFHRKEMVHQDLKPENVMISAEGHVKIIDFGSTFVAGLKEVYTPVEHSLIQGTANYVAPELFAGYEASPKTDMFSLAVTLYEMLSGGHFPYPAQEKAMARKHYQYTSIRHYNEAVPVWMDGAVRKAVDPQPDKRYPVFSEFLYDLCHPNAEFMKAGEPLIERSPLAFWRAMAAILVLSNLITLIILL